MRKWTIVAYPGDDGLPRREATVEANSHTEAIDKGFRMFPEYHEIGAFAAYDGKE